MVTIHKEIAMIVAINEKGETALYPAVDMVFDPSPQPVGLPDKPRRYPRKELMENRGHGTGCR